MASKVGSLIKEARTGKGWTQEQLAKKISGVSAADISKYERGEVVPTQAVMKEIAKQTGVTQSSLINAAKDGTAAKSTTKASTTKASSTKSTAAKSAAAKKSTTPSGANVSMKVTSTEQKLIELYRAADNNTKKAATKVLKGECTSMLDSLLGTAGSGMSDVVADLITGAIGNILGGK